MEEFVKHLPKFELHAHLNGSLSASSIKELEKELYGKELLKSKTELIVLVNPTSIEKCFQAFHHMHELTATPKGLSLTTKLVIRDFVANDNVIYLELRSTPKSNEYMTKKQYLICILQTIINTEEVKTNKIIVKLLPSIDRSKPLTEAEHTLDLVLELLKCKTYANLIVGLDFSGDCTKGKFSDFAHLLCRARAHGLRLAVHCAEILQKTDIDDVLKFGINRCGHGTFLNIQQRELLAQQLVATECCLTSNVKGSTVAKYEEHHLADLLNARSPVVLCTDDCGVFDTTLTREFLIAVKTFNLQSEDIIKLSENALQYAFIQDADEKKLLENKLQSYFDKYLQNIASGFK